MKNGNFRSKGIFVVLLIGILGAGCNKEKAEAVKTAAKYFTAESITALNMIELLFDKSVSMPSLQRDDEIEMIIKDLDESPEIGPKELSFLIDETNIGAESEKVINQEFEEIKKSYYQFESMFGSLPAGSYFAKDAVKKAEKHAINLTVQLLNFAQFLNTYPVQFTARRVVIIERIAKYKLEIDDSLRKEYLKISAKEIISLREDENRAREEAILQCLKSAEAGKLVADLIRHYKEMNVSELLASTRETLGFITEISGSSKNLDSLLKKFESTKTAISQDPYWSELLEMKLVQ